MKTTEIYCSTIKGKNYWSLYRTNGRCIFPFSMHIIHCVDNLMLDEETVKGRAYVLRNWINYLLTNNTDLLAATDKLLENYRNKLLTESKPNASNNSNSRKRSINQYLRHIYSFYNWLQGRGFGKYLIGPSKAYNFFSFITEQGKFNNKEKYPLIFTNVSSKSKHRTSYTPSYETYLKFYEYFLINNTPTIAVRNCLILKIALEAGWRVESIASLSVHDFKIDQILNSEDRFTVIPAKQKYDRQTPFEISINLAMEIANYIDGPRSELFTLTKSNSDRIFLSRITGVALKSKTISSIFSKASKQLSLPYRSGIHSWRGLFTEDFIASEVDIRSELGFDTSIESISLAVADALGHTNINSQQSYVRGQKIKHKANMTFRHNQEMKELKDELQLWMEKYASLKKFLLN